MTTVLFPMSSGTVADQAVVPLATPPIPKFVDHVICLTPTLSLAVPSKVMELAVVNMVLDAGDVITSAGGVVSAAV